MRVRKNWVFLSLVISGVLLRAGFVVLANPQDPTFHSGGSDAPAYITLAGNLLNHQGFRYSGMPSAFRPPGYPLILAGFMQVFGQHYISAMRFLQFILGLLTVMICARVSARWFSGEAGRATLAIGLLLPTLIFPTAQILTECIAAFLTALFLLFLVEQQEVGGFRSAAALGITGGLEALIRFNAAALPFFGLWAVWRSKQKGGQVVRAGIIVVVTAAVVSPWFIRNEMVFHGAVLYSTHTGANAVQGVVSTQGRTQPGDTGKLREAMGWTLSELETNDPSRRSLPSELELNRRALRIVPRLWKEKGWAAIPLVGRKILDFWLSADQVLDTRMFTTRDRLIRVAGVASYLVALALAMAGINWLRSRRPQIAEIFLLYMVLFTVLHLPLVMNTRLRIPLMEPLVIILAGVGWAGLFMRDEETNEEREIPRRVMV